MAATWCRACSASVSAPLKKAVVTCDKCGTQLRVDPYAPLTSKIFLASVAGAFVAVTGILPGENLDLEAAGIGLLLLSLPVFCYFFLFLMYGTELVPAREVAIAKALARQEARVSSENIAYCPSCSQEISPTADSCPKCDASFTAPDGWKPLTTAQILGSSAAKDSKDKGKKTVSPVRRA